MRRFTRIAVMMLAVILLVSIIPVTASAKSANKLIALTFDDGPSYAQTPKLLDGLKERGVHVSFFVTGQNAKNNPSIVKRAWKEGHQICCHSYDHSLLTNLTNAEIKEQMSKTDKILDNAIGYDLDYSLRPPYGGYSDRVLSIVGVPCYYWSVDTRDWESRNATSAYNQFMRAAKNGSIVLMHDLYPTTVTAALNAIDTLLDEGYTFVTLNELMVRRGKPPEAGNIYFSAYPGDHGTDAALTKPTISYKDSSKGRRVYISGDSRAKIYYTTNGKTPTPKNSKLYKSSFAVEDGTKVKAICVYDWNGFVSETVTKTIKYSSLGAPTLTMDNGKLKVGGLPKGTEYYYTTNGAVPTKSSKKYTGSITPKPDTVYTVRGYTPGYNNGGWTWLTYSASGRTYTDMRPDCWYYTDADRAVGMGLLEINGSELSAYSPVTRAQLVMMLYRLAGSPDVIGANPGFSDVSRKGGYLEAVTWAYNAGITNGCGEDRFEPAAQATREQVCAMLTRYLRYIGANPGSGMDALEQFSDFSDISPVFREDMNVLVELGIVRGYGDGTIRPLGLVTKAEAATMLLRIKDL